MMMPFEVIFLVALVLVRLWKICSLLFIVSAPLWFLSLLLVLARYLLIFICEAIEYPQINCIDWKFGEWEFGQIGDYFGQHVAIDLDIDIDIDGCICYYNCIFILFASYSNNGYGNLCKAYSFNSRTLICKL
jgi:hypothetical protein